MISCACDRCKASLQISAKVFLDFFIFHDMKGGVSGHLCDRCARDFRVWVGVGAPEADDGIPLTVLIAGLDTRNYNQNLDVRLAYRVYGALKRAGYATLGAVALARDVDLLAVPNFGPTCLSWVRGALAHYARSQNGEAIPTSLAR